MPEVLSAPAGTAGRVIEGTVHVAVADMVGMVTLKADLSAPAVPAALQDVMGVGVPMPLTVWANGDRSVVWMAPDEVLLVMAAEAVDDAVARLEAALEGVHTLLCDVSSARTMFRLEGSGVGEVLAKGAPIDFRDAAFAVGTARRTHLGPVAVGIWRESEMVWTLVCFRSYAPYTADWLAAATAPGTTVGHF
ncbi:MAG: sarcosine oxidase subunit gamma family protein [Pseudomonadota bacterium]